MSKMIKSLKKAKEDKVIQHDVGVDLEDKSEKSPDLVIDSESIETTQAEHQENGSMENSTDSSSSGGVTVMNMKLAVGVISLIGLVAVASLLIAFHVLGEMKSTKSASMNILNDYSSEQKKIIALERKIVDLEKSKNKTSLMFKNVENNQVSLEEITIDLDMTKKVLKDLKTSDRLLLDKIIDLNKSLIKVNNNIRN